MAKSSKNLRICEKGHEYYKTSLCPVCPICANKDKPDDGFLSLLVAPARRALQNAGIDSLDKLAAYSEAEILSFHGMGPGSLPRLRKALEESNLSFKVD